VPQLRHPETDRGAGIRPEELSLGHLRALLGNIMGPEDNLAARELDDTTVPPAGLVCIIFPPVDVMDDARRVARHVTQDLVLAATLLLHLMHEHRVISH